MYQTECISISKRRTKSSVHHNLFHCDHLHLRCRTPDVALKFISDSPNI